MCGFYRIFYDMDFKELLDKEKIPHHIAIIMDGNGRWAQKKGNKRIFGHKNGAKAVREVIEASVELGIKFLTLYAFSTENWKRPKREVDALMSLLVSTLHEEDKNLMENNIRLRAIGELNSLPKKVEYELKAGIEKTSKNTGLTTILALSYSSRWEIVHAVKQLSKDVTEKKLNAEDITEQLFANYLCTNEYPDPELIIRTSGEYRLSNFLLWQSAYSELYFTDILWPDFRKNDYFEAIHNFQKRERRFGKTGNQLK